MDEVLFKGLEFALIFGVIFAFCVHQLLDIKKAQRDLAEKQRARGEMQEG
jgi:hypothetical protein